MRPRGHGRFGSSPRTVTPGVVRPDVEPDAQAERNRFKHASAVRTRRMAPAPVAGIPAQQRPLAAPTDSIRIGLPGRCADSRAGVKPPVDWPRSRIGGPPLPNQRAGVGTQFEESHAQCRQRLLRELAPSSRTESPLTSLSRGPCPTRALRSGKQR